MAMRSLLSVAAVNGDVESAFHSASGMISCNGIRPGASASGLHGGMRRLLSAVSFASSAEQKASCLKYPRKNVTYPTSVTPPYFARCDPANVARLPP